MSQNQSNPSAGENNSDGNLSANEMIAGLSQVQEEAPEQEEETQNEDDNEIEQEESGEIEEGEQEEEESEGEEANNDELAEQLLAGDPETLKKIARLAGSRSLSRIAGLTAEVRALKEQLTTNQADAKPLAEPIPDMPEVISALKTRDDINEHRKMMQKVAKDTARILEDHEEYSNTDLIKVGDKEYTKADIRKAQRNALDALSEYIPAQEAQIQRFEQSEHEMGQWNALITQQIPEFADENSELSKQLALAKNRPEYKEMMATSERPRVDFILAHALRSMHQLSKPNSKSATVAPGEKAKPKVPGSPVGAPSRPINRTGAKTEYHEKFEKTGSQQDLVAMLAKS